jgi:LmbE family N-acetylglucosaminyl deacetylase
MTILGRSATAWVGVWVVGLGLNAQTAVGGGPTGFKDPANLAGERVKARVVADDLPENVGAKALAQTLKKLGTRASLMLIVAHPDDEDGGMLAYESRGMGVRVAMMTLNRGEGGQNLMSADFEDALGLVRTQELLAADRYMGVDQMFGSVVDFGFSKTKEEALAKWGHDRVLYDCVRAVRLYRPLVIASVFVGGVTDGHGQHQVSGQMAQEVFDAAGDPKVFPDQIAQGLEPWTPLKVYARVPFARVTKDGMYDYATGKYLPVRFYNYVTKTWSTEEPKATVTVPEGEFSKVLGMSYVQFARQGLALQKTQIGGNVRLAPAGKFDVGYTRYGSRVGAAGARNGGPETEESFFDGVDVSLMGIAGLAPDAAFLRNELSSLQAIVARAQSGFSIDAPEKSAPVLAEGLKAVDGLIGKVQTREMDAREKADVLHELRVKRVQFNEALVESLGVRLTAKVEDGTDGVIPGGEVRVTLNLKRASGDEVMFERFSVESPAGLPMDGGTAADHWSGGMGKGVNEALRISLGAHALLTRPYFSRRSIEQPYYDVADETLRDSPGTPYPAVGVAQLRYQGIPFSLRSVVEDEQPVEVVPEVSVGVSPAVGIVPLGEKSITVTARVRNDQMVGVAGKVRLELPAGWKAEPESGAFALAKQGDEAEVAFAVTPKGLAAGKEFKLAAVAEVGGKSYREGYRAVGYAGLTRTNFYRMATYRAVGADVKVATGLKVAYLPGTGDAVEAALEEIGVKAATISVADVAAGRLGGYDAVVLGVRAYAAHPELAAANAKLLEYAAAGGTVIVQYNTGEMPAGPYPLTLGDEKVVEEGAAVRLLDGKAQALRWPNAITPADFDGWVEERGHGFMGTWDPRYAALTETHDVDQDPQKGGLLVASTGKGHYCYLAYALYRQMPEGVPGAFRLFANLLSLGKTE